MSAHNVIRFYILAVYIVDMTDEDNQIVAIAAAIKCDLRDAWLIKPFSERCYNDVPHCHA